MKIALGIFIGFFVCCVLFIVFAPDSAHEVIDRIHGNSDANGKLSVDPEDNSEGGVIPADEESEHGEKEIYEGLTTDPAQPPEPRNKDEMIYEGLTTDPAQPPEPRNKDEMIYEGLTTDPAQPPEPRNKDEMLDWLNIHDYKVGKGQGFYRIYWINLKEVPSRPTAIVVQRDGTVVPQYGGRIVVNNGGASSVFGQATVTNNRTNNGITTTASTKYENGSWWIEVTRSFDWVPSQDKINDVLSKAKKIKEMDDEN